MTKPIAIVIPWFGKDLKGGAEQLGWQVANRLAGRGHSVEILTTCCSSFLDDWSGNQLPAGVEQVGALSVHRFKVDKRRGDLFNQANSQALAIPSKKLKAGVNPFSLVTGHWFVNENINSIPLERYLQKNKSKYHAFVFLPYLYGIILNGLSIVAEKAWLQPCLHDEVYAYHPAVERCMRESRGLLYNSLGEERLAIDLYGPGILRKGEVVGVGIESPDIPKSQLLANIATGTDLRKGGYILCLGRRDKTKNTSMLVQAYKRYRRSNPASPLQLIIAGPGDEQFGETVEGVQDLGLVSDADKELLLANCKALFQPSKNESYSRVIMEAWFYKRPVAVHAQCLATAMAVRAAAGGLLASNDEEWAVVFNTFAEMEEDECLALGKKGKEYAKQYANWDAVIDRYEEVLGLNVTEGTGSSQSISPRIKSIHQLMPGFAFGDAISNQALVIRQLLREKGYASEIITEHLDPVMTHEAKLFADGKWIPDDVGLIYHHSIGAGLTEFVIQHSGPKALIYHNVTPPDLVREIDPGLAEILEQGIKDLPLLAPHFPISVGDSHFNCQDLEANGFVTPGLLSICVSPEKWNVLADPNMMFKLQDGKDNILFVGRLVSNKCQHDLIQSFAAYHRMYGNCRLVLVGGFVEEESYYQALMQQVRVAGLENDVLFAGKVSDSVLHACYRCAHLYWSMSEHEGFGVPLVEAMWFDLPVLAYKSSAIPETMREGGLFFTDKTDVNELAATARLLIHDKELKNNISLGQQHRRVDFLPEAIEAQLTLLVDQMNG